MNKSKLSTRDLCIIAIFTAIIAALAQISVPTPYGISMTMQTFAIPLAGIVAGAKRGAIATLIYIFLGAIGIPVFAGFTGGMGIVFGMSGGFILSFPVLALIAGIAESKNNKVWLVSGLFIGAVINFLCGMIWFSVVTSSNLRTAFMLSALPFIPTEIIKIVLVIVLGRQIKKSLIKEKVLV